MNSTIQIKYILKSFLSKIFNRIPKILNEYGLIYILRKPFWYSKFLFYVNYSKFKISKLKDRYTLESLIEFVKFNNQGLIRPLQINYEILTLLKLLKKKDQNLFLK